jgi:hypothetical protein
MENLNLLNLSNGILKITYYVNHELITEHIFKLEDGRFRKDLPLCRHDKHHRFLELEIIKPEIEKLTLQYNEIILDLKIIFNELLKEGFCFIHANGKYFIPMNEIIYIDFSNEIFLKLKTKDLIKKLDQGGWTCGKI